MSFTPTRAAGVARLADFLPRAGRAYASHRNVDRGPGDRSNVSGLSPWIRRRLITEEEVLRATLGNHRFADAEKFVQEVYWRTYWKGWLEMRPSVWSRYQADVERLSFDVPSRLQRHLQSAEEARTGIACFDAWMTELAETGWLHNHTRMWFASIWIFTLRLPWQLGADLFARHLVDFDPASNTLSWRWVAGLHTRGKHYLATADNIARNTQGRFNPVGELNERASPLDLDEVPPVTPMRLAAPPPTDGRIGLLITDEDLHPESLPLPFRPTALAILPPTGSGSGEAATAFGVGAIDDTATRAEAHFDRQVARPVDLLAWAQENQLDHVVTAELPIGPTRDAVLAATRPLTEAGIGFHRVRRAHDDAAWPHATKGFFALKEKIPTLLGRYR